MKALGIAKNKAKIQGSDSENSDDEFGTQDKKAGGKKQANTIMQ